MHKLLFHFLLLISVTLFTACHRTTPEQQKILAAADSLMPARPDSALHLLKKIRDYRHLSSPGRALYALLMTQALDKCDSVIASDSLISFATDYYGRKDPNRAGSAWFYRAHCCNNMGDARGQAGALLKALEYADQGRNYKLKGLVFSEKAQIFQQQNMPDSALYYIHRAYRNFEAANDTYNVIVSLWDFGRYYYSLREYDKAGVYFHKATIQAEQYKDSILVATAYRLEGDIMKTVGNYREALVFIQRSLLISRDLYDVGKYYDLASVYTKMHQYDSARFYIGKALKSKRVDLKSKQAYIDLLATIEAERTNYKAAYERQTYSKILADSIRKRELSESFAGLERKYKFDGLTSENQALTIRNQQIVIILLVLVLAIGTGAGTFTLWRRKLKKTLLGKEEAIARHQQEQDALLQQKFKAQQIALLIVNLQKNQLSADIAKENNPAKLKNLEQMLQEAARNIDALHKELIESVDSRNPQFSTRLAKQYPALSEDDRLICCMLLAGFDSATIASLMNTLPSSFNMRRTRLRSKLSLPHEMNLVDFLAKF